MAIKALAEVDSATNTIKNGVKVTSAQISDATTTGKAVLTAATAVAARTAIGAPDANATPTKATTLSSLAVSGSTLTATKADGTTQAVTLPSGGTGGGTTSIRAGAGIAITQDADGTLVISTDGTTGGGTTTPTTPPTTVAGSDVTGTEKLSPAQVSLQSGWDGTPGSTDVATPAGGPFVIDATTDLLQAMAGVGTAGGQAITAGKKYTVTVLTSGSGTVQVYTSWMKSDWGFLAEDNYTTGSGKIQFTCTAPATAAMVSLYIKGVSGVANITSASMKEVA